MAFYIESRFVDIRTLVDFSEFDEADFNSSPALTANSDLTINKQEQISTQSSIQSTETLNNSQALQEVTKIVIENENKNVSLPSITSGEPANNISSPVSSGESVLVNKLSETTLSPVAVKETALPAPKIEIVDKTTLYTQYINQKYTKDTAAELIKILLNPYIVILAYRYELDENKDNISPLKLQILKKTGDLEDSKTGNGLEDTNESESEQKNLRELLEYNRKRDLLKKMQRQSGNFQQFEIET